MNITEVEMGEALSIKVKIFNVTLTVSPQWLYVYSSLIFSPLRCSSLITRNCGHPIKHHYLTRAHRCARGHSSYLARLHVGSVHRHLFLRELPNIRVFSTDLKPSSIRVFSLALWPSSASWPLRALLCGVVHLHAQRAQPAEEGFDGVLLVKHAPLKPPGLL